MLLSLSYVASIINNVVADARANVGKRTSVLVYLKSQDIQSTWRIGANNT